MKNEVLTLFLIIFFDEFCGVRPIDGEEFALVVRGRKTRAIIPGLGISNVLCNEVSKFVQDTCYAVAHLCYEMKRERRQEKGGRSSVAFRECGKFRRGQLPLPKNGPSCILENCQITWRDSRENVQVARENF